MSAPDPSTALLIALHDGLPRQGPGDRASTLRALSLCGPLPAAPRVADLGCGSGAQTLDLAHGLGLSPDGARGQVDAVDLAPGFIEALRARAAAAGLGAAVRASVGDLADTPLPAGAFDLVWSEGALYTVGLARGLTAARGLLKPGGRLAFTELCWLGAARPPAAVDFWAAAYPALRAAEAVADSLPGLGLRLIDRFALPPEAWRAAYYGPLAARLPAFAAAHAGDPLAAAVLDETRQEMALFEAHHDAYGYVFFVAERVG